MIRVLAGMGRPTNRIGPLGMMSFYLPLVDLGAGAVNTTAIIGGAASFTRATTAWTKLSTGLWASVASGTARSLYTGLDTTVGVYAGYLSENIRTNFCLWSRDLTNVAWTKTSMTAALDQAGIDGVTNSASSLLATAANGTATQAIVIASALYAYGVFVKRITGTGQVLISLDNFATTTDITASINSSTYTKVFATQTLLNPTLGIKIVTSGDKIAVDMNQMEAYVQSGPNVSSTPIPTTTVSVTRNADVLVYPIAGSGDASAGSCYAEISLLTSVSLGSIAAITFMNDLDTPNLSPGADTTVTITDGAAGNSATKAGLSAYSTGVRKRASSWGPAGLAVTGDGLAPATAAFDGAMSNIQIGIGTDNNHQIFGTVKNVRIWKRQLPNAVLQMLTT